MSRQYVSPDEFKLTPIGIGMDVTSLPSTVLDRVLMRASARCDSYCRRKLGSCGTTTLSATIQSGVSIVPLTSTLGFDGGPDTLLQIGTSGTQEFVRCSGIPKSTMTYTGAYPGSMTLYPGVVTRFVHNSGETVKQFYYEQDNPLTSGTSPMDQYYDATQAGQIAQAHAPRLGLGGNVRVIFLRQRPILQLIAFSVAYPWANVLDAATVSDLFISNAEGWVRLPIGYFNPPDSVVHTTYDAGYLVVPDDVQQAVIYEAAAELAFQTNFLGAEEFSRDNYTVRWSRGFGNPRGSMESKILLSNEARSILAAYRSTTL